jgi:hypothetical protein
MPRPASNSPHSGRRCTIERGLAVAVMAMLTLQSSTSWPSLIGFAKSKKYAPRASVNQS